ncbi:unnamed protein product, partial [Rotaria sp. Silwood1]
GSPLERSLCYHEDKKNVSDISIIRGNN